MGYVMCFTCGLILQNGAGMYKVRSNGSAQVVVMVEVAHGKGNGP